MIPVKACSTRLMHVSDTSAPMLKPLHAHERPSHFQQNLNEAHLNLAREAPLVMHCGQWHPGPRSAPEVHGSGSGSSAPPRWPGEVVREGTVIHVQAVVDACEPLADA